MRLRVLRPSLVPVPVRSRELGCFQRYTQFSTNNTPPPRTIRTVHCTRNFSMPAASQNLSKKNRILVFGAGNFGSCLADHLGDSQHDVFMWSREADLVKHFNLHHRNLRYLKDHDFSPNITAIGPALPEKEFLRSMQVLLFAIPTQGLRCVPTTIYIICSLLLPEKLSRNCARVLTARNIHFLFLSTKA
jgi:hypothetical protein